MTDTEMQLLLSRSAAALIRESGTGGTLTSRVSAPSNVGAVTAVSDTAGTNRPCPLQPATHFLNSCDRRTNGRWFRTSRSVFELWWGARTRGAGISCTAFAEHLQTPPPITGGSYLAVTYSPDDADTPFEMLGWTVAKDTVFPIDLAVEPEQQGIASLAPAWPASVVRQLRVLLVGVGSIGSATAHALADYGVGQLVLLDPDRLRWHNLVRHRSGPRHVGALKVTAVRDELSVLRPDTHVHDLPLDVCRDADRVRAILSEVDVVVCCADGVAPRRVVSHLARRARRPAVLGCVLDDGAVGEIVRLRPWREAGCLACRRRALRDQGGLDPEPSLDAPYGTGSRERPMTAVGGDLNLMGALVASASVHTALESAGYPEHRLAGEHAIIGLRPSGDLAAPFDTARALDLRWEPATPPLPECPTCGPISPP